MRKLLAALALCLLIPCIALAQEGLRFSYESGFYADPIDVELLWDDPDADVYYTLDGTVPNEDSFYYDGAFHLEDRIQEPNDLSARGGTAKTDYIPEENVVKGHVIRALAVYPDGSTQRADATFFVGIDRQERYGDVPVISLMMDANDLFDYETGIYVLGRYWVEWDAQQTEAYADWETQGNFSQKGRAWERPVTVQYLTADGSEGFTQDMGVRIKGGVTRSFTQKSLRLIARADYGEKNLKYPVLPDNQRADGTGLVEKYKSITLRNGGNDAETTRLRDPLLQSLADGLNFMTQASTPCVVFINGEYWGMYAITEEYSDKAIQNNYGVDADNVVMVKTGELEEGQDEDMLLFENMFDFIANGDMTDPDSYAEASQMLDMTGFAQYCALHLYLDDQDGLFKNNNWMIWRVRETSDEPYSDGQWRFLLFDVDQTADIWGNGRDFLADPITAVITDDGSSHEDRHPQKLFYSLYQNEDFRQEFIMALCDIRNINYQADRAVAALDSMRPTYEKLMRDTYLRFGPEWIAKWMLDTHQANELEELATYLRGRYDRFPYVLKKVIGYDYPVEATVTVNDISLGSVQANSTQLPLGESYTGLYFTEYPITLTAIPEEGHTFKGWTVDGATPSSTEEATITVTFDKAFTVQAVFE